MSTKSSQIKHGAFLSITIIGLIYVSSLGIKNIFRYNKLRFEHEEAVQAYQLEKTRNQSFQEKLHLMKSNHYWELTAKQKLGFQKPKETVYIK